MSHGIYRYPGKTADLRADEKRPASAAARGSMFNDLWRTVPTGPAKSKAG
jgi:hypothetical protein